MRGFWNLFAFELKQNRRSLIVWTISIGLIIIMYMSLFPSFKSSDMMDIVNAKMNAMPKALTQAMGLDVYFNLQDIMFYSAYMFQFIVIAISIYAINLGSRIISKEHEDKHIDYLASQPIKKETIVLAKYFAFVSLVIILTFLVTLISFLISTFYNQTGNLYLVETIRLSFKEFFVFLFFGTLSFLTTMLSKKTEKTSTIVLGIFFLSYILGVMSKMQDKLEKLEYLSPYYIFETVKAYNGLSTTEMFYVFSLLILCVFMLFSSIHWYRKKDLSL